MEKSHVIDPVSNNTKTETATTKREKIVDINSHKHGLANFRAIVFLLLWYFFSGCTLFLNKYILTYLNGNPTVLGSYTD